MGSSRTNHCWSRSIYVVCRRLGTIVGREIILLVVGSGDRPRPPELPIRPSAATRLEVWKSARRAAGLMLFFGRVDCRFMSRHCDSGRVVRIARGRNIPCHSFSSLEDATLRGLPRSVQPIFRNSTAQTGSCTPSSPLSTKGRMKVTPLLHTRNLIGCRRNVESERPRHPESYPSET